MKARIWKDREAGAWRFYVWGRFYDRSSLRPTWEEALSAAVAELDVQRAVRA